MGRFIDITGNTYGRLKVLKRSENRGKTPMWLCKCECGNETIVDGFCLRHGITKSCGCLQKEVASNLNKTHHQAKRTKLYNTWCNMKQRCLNPNNPGYKDYGGRGIDICEIWKNDYMEFYNWAISNGYKDGLYLDRIDNDKGYSPNNCRWVTNKENCNNMRKNHLVTYNGKTLTVSQWADELNINYSSLCTRLSNGWSMEKIIKTPVKLSKRLIEHDGEIKSLADLSKEYGIKFSTLKNRLTRGWDLNSALTKPVRNRRK